MSNEDYTKEDPHRTRRAMIYVLLMFNQLVADTAEDAFRAVEREKSLYRFGVKREARRLSAAVARYNDYTYRVTKTSSEPLDDAANRMHGQVDADIQKLFYTFKNAVDARNAPYSDTIATVATAFTIARMGMQLYFQIARMNVSKGCRISELSPEAIAFASEKLLHETCKVSGLTEEFFNVPHLKNACDAIRNRFYDSGTHEKIMSNN